ncbi:O-antigen ligase family protein [Desulfosporosinus hippei]|uniref:O-antigen ligase n=1 Tax=Desulfosporosinus hippei DSM 8344 TaxID=1121419 RepID=A0A1G8H1F4_9FIRM|nr:O-antigen ligase family protein [Desulfosporosinus hippei]SDI00512.1 O-antigen ligase [Desulfosporosinus hippei DSM 8344]
MSGLLYALLNFFVFTIPWENISVIPKVGTISKLIGIILMAVYLVEVKKRQTLTRPNGVIVMMFLFVFWSGLSILWSINIGLTYDRLLTDIQLLCMVWMIFDLADSDMLQKNLMQAYVLGAYVSVISTLKNFAVGQNVVYNRYAASGFDPNDLGVMIALAIPLAIYLTAHGRPKIFKALNVLFIPIGSIAILMTASRTAAVVAAVALIYVLVGIKMKKTTRMVLLALLGVGGLFAIRFLPSNIFFRLATITSEMTTGTLNDRTILWMSGLSYFVEHPLLGVGAGAFRTAMFERLGYSAVAHNSYISILVETGIVGIILMSFIIGSLFYRICWGLDKHRMVFFLLIMILLGIFMLSWEYRKPTWFILALVLSTLHIRGEPLSRADSAK